MRLQSKPVWLLIGVHTLSLGVGFWFLYRLFVTSAENQAVELAWNDLVSQSRQVADVARTLESSEIRTDGARLARFRSLNKLHSDTDHTGFLLVSWDWHALAPGLGTDGEVWRTGELVEWRCDRTPATASEPLRGVINSPKLGRRAAIAYPVADESAYLAAYDPRPLSPPWMIALIKSLPVAAGIAFLWTWILSSVSTFLVSAHLKFEKSNLMSQQEREALRSAQDLVRTRDAVIFGLAKLAESRDPETGHHLERISLYSVRLATALRSMPKYERIVTPAFVRLLGISSVLHDIGKVGLEDTVLLKPGKLTDAERKKMQQHTLVAGECLREIELRLGESNFLQTAREIALHHHERWDGNGYPAGLAGESIPLAARIVTIADVYDALSSKRVYKDAFPHDVCVRLIREEAGSQFDPQLVDVFLSVEADFASIARQFAAAQGPVRTPSPKSDGGERMSREQEAVLLNLTTTSRPSTSANATQVEA